jgi:Flp pilus assembly CpaF family ATPase
MRMNVECVGVNELRGAEAYDLCYNIWLSDHDGCSTTTHARDWRSGLWRLETLVSQSPHVPDRGVDRRLIAEAIDLVVTLKKMQQNGRRVVEMVKIDGATGSAGEYQYRHLTEPELGQAA